MAQVSGQRWVILTRQGWCSEGRDGLESRLIMLTDKSSDCTFSFKLFQFDQIHSNNWELKITNLQGVSCWMDMNSQEIDWQTHLTWDNLHTERFQMHLKTISWWDKHIKNYERIFDGFIILIWKGNPTQLTTFLDLTIELGVTKIRFDICV